MFDPLRNTDTHHLPRLFPPLPAQRSSTVSPRWARHASATSWLPSSYTYIHCFVLFGVVWGFDYVWRGGGWRNAWTDVGRVCVCFFLFTCTSKSPSRQPASPHSPIGSVGGGNSVTYSGNTREISTTRHESYTYVSSMAHVLINLGAAYRAGAALC